MSTTSDSFVELRKLIRTPNSSFSDAQDYADSVRRLERVRGERHLRELAEFLTGPWNPETRNRSSQRRNGLEDSIGDGLITSYDFSPTETLRKHDIRSFGQLESEACGPFSPEQSGRLIFLRGHQHAHWLSHICGHYEVHYEFLRRHIEFPLVKNPWRNFERPALPPISPNIIRTTITVVGHRHSGLDPLDPEDREKVRTQQKNVNELIQNQLECLANPHRYEGTYGESIVRRMTVHDGEFFSKEHDISIYIGETPGGWIVLVWSDLGRGLDAEGFAHSLGCKVNNVKCIRNIQHRPLRTKRRRVHRTSQASNPPDLSTLREESCTAHKVSWNGSNLGTDYGQYLDLSAAATDIFYLLSEIFELYTSSEGQFLDVMRDQLEHERAHARDDRNQVPKTVILDSLDNNRNCLKRHRRQLERLIALTRSKDDLSWPRPCANASPATGSSQFDRSNVQMQMNLDALLRSSDDLIKEFDASIAFITNSALAEESQRAIAEAKRNTGLSTLAFFFIPLSLTASVFGMNFQEIADDDGNKLSIWVWVVASLGVLSISLTYLVLNGYVLRIRWRPKLPSPRRWMQSTKDMV